MSSPRAKSDEIPSAQEILRQADQELVALDAANALLKDPLLLKTFKPEKIVEIARPYFILANAHLQLAQAYREFNLPDKALVTYIGMTFSSEQSHHHHTAYIESAEIYLAQDNFDNANRILNVGMKKYPQLSAQYSGVLGRVAFRQLCTIIDEKTCHQGLNENQLGLLISAIDHLNFALLDSKTYPVVSATILNVLIFIEDFFVKLKMDSSYINRIDSLLYSNNQLLEEIKKCRTIEDACKSLPASLIAASTIGSILQLRTIQFYLRQHFSPIYMTDVILAKYYSPKSISPVGAEIKTTNSKPPVKKIISKDEKINQADSLIHGIDYARASAADKEKFQAALEIYIEINHYEQAANIYLLQKKYTEAIKYYDLAIMNAGSFRVPFQLFFKKAKALAKLGHHDAPINLYEKYLNENPGARHIYHYKIANAYCKGNYVFKRSLAAKHYVLCLTSPGKHPSAPEAFATFLNENADKDIFSKASRRKLFEAIKQLPQPADQEKYLRQCLDSQTALGKRMLVSESMVSFGLLKFSLAEIEVYLNKHFPKKVEPVATTHAPIERLSEELAIDQPKARGTIEYGCAIRNNLFYSHSFQSEENQQYINRIYPLG